MRDSVHMSSLIGTVFERSFHFSVGGRRAAYILITKASVKTKEIALQRSLCTVARLLLVASASAATVECRGMGCRGRDGFGL